MKRILQINSEISQNRISLLRTQYNSAVSQYIEFARTRTEHDRRAASQQDCPLNFGWFALEHSRIFASAPEKDDDSSC